MLKRSRDKQTSMDHWLNKPKSVMTAPGAVLSVSLGSIQASAIDVSSTSDDEDDAAPRMVVADTGDLTTSPCLAAAANKWKKQRKTQATPTASAPLNSLKAGNTSDAVQPVAAPANKSKKTRVVAAAKTKSASLPLTSPEAGNLPPDADVPVASTTAKKLRKQRVITRVWSNAEKAQAIRRSAEKATATAARAAHFAALRAAAIATEQPPGYDSEADDDLPINQLAAAFYAANSKARRHVKENDVWDALVNTGFMPKKNADAGRTSPSKTFEMTNKDWKGAYEGARAMCRFRGLRLYETRQSFAQLDIPTHETGVGFAYTKRKVRILMRDGSVAAQAVLLAEIYRQGVLCLSAAERAANAAASSVKLKLVHPRGSTVNTDLESTRAAAFLQLLEPKFQVQALLECRRGDWCVYVYCTLLHCLHKPCTRRYRAYTEACRDRSSDLSVIWNAIQVCVIQDWIQFVFFTQVFCAGSLKRPR